MNKSFDAMKKAEQNEAVDKKLEKRAKWLPFQKYWVLYVALVATALLSVFAGLYIGISPSAEGNIIATGFWDYVRMGFFAIFFAVGFVANAEGATLFWETKLIYHDVDKDGKPSKHQKKIATVALVVAIIAVVTTGLAAARFLAAWTGSLDKLQEVPAVAQEWVVWSIPILFVFNAVCAILYWFYSEDARLSRYKDMQIRQTQANMSEIETNAFVEEYRKIAPQMAQERGRKLAKQKAQEDFWAREKAENRDIDGDGRIGQGSQQEAPRRTEMAPATKDTEAAELAESHPNASRGKA